MSYSRISLFDLDRTLLDCNVSLEYYLFLLKKKILPPSSFPPCFFHYFKHRFLALSLMDLHEAAFNSFLRSRLRGELTEHIDEFIDEVFPKLIYFPAFMELKKASHMGHYVAILTSSPSFLAAPIARKLGVEDLFASEYEVDSEGRFSEITTIMEGERKASIAGEISANLSVDMSEVSVYSDSYHDLAFLVGCGDPVVVNPDKRLREYGVSQNWTII